MGAIFVTSTGAGSACGLQLSAQPKLIGRSPHADLVLVHPSVSRRHCEIWLDPLGLVCIRDLGSTNGTWVDGKMIQEVALKCPVAFRVGDVELRVASEEAASGSPSKWWSTTCRVDQKPSLHHGLARPSDEVPEGAGPRATEAWEASAASRDLYAWLAECVRRSRSKLGAILKVVAGTQTQVLQLCSYPERVWKVPRSVEQWAQEAVVACNGSNRTCVRKKSAAPNTHSSLLICLSCSGSGWVLYLEGCRPEDGFVLQLEQTFFRVIGTISNKGWAESTAQKELPRSVDQGEGLERVFVGGKVLEPMRELVRKAASCDCPVLILGETGTGKELVANLIHQLSPRSNAPFLAVNCAALHGNLLESELFGHEKGAFTGAIARRRGIFERAHRGSLLLDEIGEMELALQAKVLRILETRRFERLGGEQSLEVDVRILAATNKDLARAVRDGSFRLDLLYRLDVLTIKLPPLRERPEDIPLLCEALLKQLAPRYGCADPRLTPRALEKLLRHSWPGNVRELRHCLERALVLARGPTIGPQHIVLQALEGERSPTATLPLQTWSLVEAQRAHLRSVLQATSGNKAEAARRLGIHRGQLYKLLRRHGLHS
jgi:DNA-binding NtrC family response regulator